MTDKPKYAVGDVVEFCGNQAEVVAVNEHHYFYGGTDAYYLYDLKYVAGGTMSQVSESALNLISRTTNANMVKRYCECGAWSIFWASEHHARWCPEHKMFERNDE